jgi:hypothetical protein
MKPTHAPATKKRPIRGRQRLFLFAAGVVGAIVVVATVVVIVLVRVS